MLSRGVLLPLRLPAGLVRALRVALSSAGSLAVRVPSKPTFDSVRCGFTRLVPFVLGFAENDPDLSNFLAAPCRVVRLSPVLGIITN